MDAAESQPPSPEPSLSESGFVSCVVLIVPSDDNLLEWWGSQSNLLKVIAKKPNKRSNYSVVNMQFVILLKYLELGPVSDSPFFPCKSLTDT